MTLDGFWLPGLAPADVTAWETRDLGDTALRWPVLTPESLARVVRAITRARAETLARTPTAAIVRALDAAAARLADPADPLRRTAEAALPAVTGYAPEMIRLGLDRMVADWGAPALERLLRAELPDPAALDRFVDDPAGAGAPRAGRRLLRAHGPELAFHVFAGNVPGVAVTSLVRSLLVRAATLGKTAAGEPVLPALFAHALAEVAPDLALALAVTYWPGGTTELEAVALDAADAVVVYGGAESLASLQRRLRPGARLLEHGPRYSFGIVGREALDRASAPPLAQTIARAVAIFDQQGCVSPHVVYVERGGEVGPEEMAGLVAGALADLEARLPRGRLSPGEAAALHEARGAAEFRAIAGQDVRLHTGGGTGFTVAYDADPAFAPSCLNRFLWIKPVGDVGEVTAHVIPYARWLQTVAVGGIPADRLEPLAEALAAAGACRIAGFADAPWPPAQWHHDGRGPLAELLRWTDLEPPQR